MAPNERKRVDLDDVKDIVKAKRPMSEIADATSSYQQLKCACLSMQLTSTLPTGPVEIRWHYCPPGCSKTYDAWKEFPDLYTPLSFKWWENYQGEEVVLIVDFRKDWCKFHELIKLIDDYPVKAECKGSFYHVQAKVITITSPFHQERIRIT